MRIYTMTATFGKLEHETLTLKPGLNIIEAPNEWGKSTWSAFLLAMLYGLDTRAKTTKSTLADKERFAPWSGSPMAGRIDLNWQGRDITIERHTRRRIPLGEFRAYETETGLPVPELTAANCGQQLLGVEQSVFRRSGFIRHSDLPVTQDEALRRRLNALVTTGDESGAADRLAKDLKDLKNRVRYNRSGLLPQAEAERDALLRKLQDLDSLNTQCRKLRLRLDELKQWRGDLENHRRALAYSASLADAQKVAQARDARDLGLDNLTRLEHAAASLPDLDTARREADRLQKLTEQWNDLQLEWEMLPPMPEETENTPPFTGLTGEEAMEMASADYHVYTTFSRRPPLVPWLLLLLSLAACAAVWLLAEPVWVLIPGLAAIVSAAVAISRTVSRSRLLRSLEMQYGNSDPDLWLNAARKYRDTLARHQQLQEEYRAQRENLEQRRQKLHQQRLEASRGQSPEKALYLWNQAIRCWEEYHNALRDQQLLEDHLHDLQTMARTGEKPAQADELTYTEAQTLTLLNDASAEQQRLQQRLSQCRGQMEALGDPEVLKRQLEDLNQRIAKLEDHYAALTVAQETLLEARLELQRRFAPRIASRAQQLLSMMTGGRYVRMTLGEDFSLRSRTDAEDTLHEVLWRSDGTMDQLYLALRLAVSEALTPEAPLILDDALVRFDDSRLQAALTILQETAKEKQVILFTCQSRENRLLKTQ